MVDFSLFRRHNNCYSGAVLFFKVRWGLEDGGVQRVESCVSKYYFVCDLLGKIEKYPIELVEPAPSIVDLHIIYILYLVLFYSISRSAQRFFATQLFEFVASVGLLDWFIHTFSVSKEKTERI